MSSSEDEIKAIKAIIRHGSSTEKLLARPALQVMLDLVDLINTTDPNSQVLGELLLQYLARIRAEPLVKITASEAGIAQIAKLFGLNYDMSTDAWELAEESILEEPKILRRNLNDLHAAFYEEESEATCRVAIDIILIQCRKYLRLKYDPTETKTASLAAPATPLKDTLNVPAEISRKPLKLYPESSISVEISDPSVPNSSFLVSGRADWAVGYGSKAEDGALLVAMEAKQRSEFSTGESQLITYLAILREHRRRAGKTNLITQGFYSDGSRFGFISIEDDGRIWQSQIWETRTRGGLKMVFSFIVAMLETAMKNTPTASPTKPGVLQDTEIHNYDDKVWAKIYRSVKESLVVGDDSDDMDDVIDLS